MKKVLLLFALIISVAVNAYTQESYTINFKSVANSPTPISTTTKASTFIATTDYFEASPVTSSENVYYGGNDENQKSSIRFGSSSKAGNITLKLSEAGQINATSIIVTAKKYGSDENTQVTICGQSFTVNTTDYAEYTVTLGGEKLETLSISTTGTNKNRVYIKTIQIVAGASSSKTASEIAFEQTEYTATLNQDFDSPTATITAGDGVVTYSSSNTNVATVNETTGAVTLVAAGTTTITASIAETDAYKGATATYTLKVVDPNAPAAEKFVLVTDASTLVNGQKIIIVSNSMALSTTQNNNNRGATTITIADGGIVPSDDVQIITLEINDGKYSFNVGNGYLYAASSSNNYLKTQTTLDDNGKATISIVSSGIATIKFQGTNSRNLLKYNSSSKLFSCYASGQEDVQIYALPAQSTEPVDPEAPAAPVISESWNKVTITAEEGTTIYYTTHESWDETEHADPTTESTEYTEPIEFYGSFSIKAIAVKDGKTSTVASYDVNTLVFEDLSSLSDITSDWSAYKFVFNCPLTVVYQDAAKRNLYVNNGYNNMLIYGGNQAAYAPGDVINGVCATVDYYNGLQEFLPTAFGEVNTAAGTVPQPAEIDYSNVAENFMHQYVMLPSVTISSINDKTIAATDAEGHEITVYNKFGITAPTVGTKCDVTGFVGVFGTTYQIYPTEFTSNTGKISLGEAYSYNEYSKANVLTFTATISKNGNPIDEVEKANYEVLLDGVSVGHAGETFSHFAYNKDGKFSLKNGDRTIALDVEWPDLDAVLPTITEAKYITYSDNADRTDAKYYIEAPGNSYNWTFKSTDENAIVGWDNERAFCLYENATPDTINVKITFPFAVTKAIAPLAADVEYDIVTYEPDNATELSTAEFAKNDDNTEVSGVADVAVDQNSAVEYYNLQGVRVNGDLTPGLYIRRQGNQATKVVVR